MKKSLVFMVLLLLCGSAFADPGDYDVSKIPDALKKNAHVVKRMEQITFELLNTDEVIMHRKYALTILDENGDYEAEFREYYDKFHEIKNIEGILYDASGKELKKLKNKQVLDMSDMSDDALATDDRIKRHSFYYKVYPYTVQYDVEIKLNATFYFPPWLPREAEHFSVEQSSVSFISPPEYSIRYKALNYPGPPVESKDKEKRTLTWEVKGLPAVEDEFASPSWIEMNTVVLFAPTQFEIDKYHGNMESWQGFGKFQFELNQGRDQLPDNIKQTVHQIADGISDTRDKIAKLYEYMQKNTRYISVQLGIGGLQPFDAKYVGTKSYGDCKALSNYMYSILKEAGVNSCFTLVRAGRNADKVFADFPSFQFNHVILCVPMSKDSIWLECTSQTLPAGYLSEFTCDRYALMVNENGGNLVRTPVYGMNDNREIRRIKATLDEESTLKIRSLTTYTGLQQDMYHGLIHSLSKDKVKEFLHEQLDFATYDVTNFDYKETRAALPSMDETLDIEVSNYATITGRRLFIIPNVMTRTHRKLAVDEERKFDLELGFAYNDVDSVEISIPAGYKAESLPQDVSLASKFGKYSCSVKLNGNQLFYYRNMEYYGGHFPATDYTELAKFYETVYKSDRNKVVLVKDQPAGF